MKHLIFILFSILITSFVKAQTNYQEVVYLKNGSIIRGVIIEQVPNVALKIQTADKSVWVFEFEEIEKITKEEIQPTKKEVPVKEKFESREKGLSGIIRGGVFASPDGLYFSATATIGYQFNKKYSLSVGSGIFGGTKGLIPLFLMNRINFLDGRVTPTIGVEIGYIYIETPRNYYSSRGHFDSVYLNPSVGLKLRMTKNTSWVFDFGYRYWTVLENDEVNMVSFQTGVEF